LIDHTKTGCFGDVMFDESFTIEGASDMENIMYRMLAIFMRAFICSKKYQQELLPQMKQSYFLVHPEAEIQLQQLIKQARKKKSEEISQEIADLFDEVPISDEEFDPVSGVRNYENSYMRIIDGEVVTPGYFNPE